MSLSTIRRTRADKVFDTVNIIIMILLLIITLYPLYFVVIASVSDPYEVAKGNVFMFPKGFTVESYLNGKAGSGQATAIPSSMRWPAPSSA